MSCTKNISRGCCFKHNQDNKLTAQSVDGGHKMEVWDWLESMPKPVSESPQLVEVRFKNTRKGYYENINKLPLKRGDIIAVEGTPGTDIGIVSMTSQLVARQIKRTGFKVENGVFKKILRKANNIDIERWSEAIAKEHSTMIESRKISADLGLEMKIGDVEYQGDGMKAIFYYIADGRVDFRELIKVLFERFRVRVEMKQIGARQEAGRIGGIGACGRELCCSGWINSFSTIGIGAARAQDISFNPQKLAGQCSKLKCCLNYEVDSYIDAKKHLPRVSAPLEAMDGSYYLSKTDPLAGIMYFSPSPHDISIQIPLSIERVREIQALNARGERVAQIADQKFVQTEPTKIEPQLQNIELDDSLTRFDNNKDNRPKNNRNRNNRKGQHQRNNKNTPSSEASVNARPKSETQQNKVHNKPQNNEVAAEKNNNKAKHYNRPKNDRQKEQGGREGQRQNNRERQNNRAPKKNEN